jgi:hypothetical protein
MEERPFWGQSCIPVLPEELVCPAVVEPTASRHYPWSTPAAAPRTTPAVRKQRCLSNDPLGAVTCPDSGRVTTNSPGLSLGNSCSIQLSYGPEIPDFNPCTSELARFSHSWIDMANKAVLSRMRGRRLGLALAGLMTLVPFLDAQQTPEYGCRMGVSCRPSGFAILNRDRGVGMQVGLGLGFRWGPGFDVFVPGTENLTVYPKPIPIPDGQVFHLGTSLLAPPPPAPTLPLVTLPAATPTPTPSDQPKS